MIKFSLTIWVCSFLGVQSVCMPPMLLPVLYDSWYECSRRAHQESLKLISKMEKEMKAAAARLDFERAAQIRDRIYQLENPTN